ncbi:PIGMENT DEFECTIVE 191 [Micractinium conductrix]|uniref:PIGMENT DEFECTIVE 191 n=1 Tax=Micractinium conductrix TaxID=554055 RepID=A0A2P6V9X0_9CHLO|nr:PIGMENT DEFECTIVE 191 [Micractinium conductrix]|eukprot:PSC70887.1 PIGMENT DEFECTIVE 191 [Micractinium conductrix]
MPLLARRRRWLRRCGPAGSCWIFGLATRPEGRAKQCQLTAAGATSSGSAEASSTAAQANPPPLIDASRVDAVCRELLDTVLLPVAQLHRALVEAPELLACTPAELRKQHEVLLPVWRRPRRLAAAVQEFPSMLTPDFPAELSAGLGTLSQLGFTREQVSKAILRWPAVVQLRRADIVRTLRRAGLSLDNAEPEVFQFLAEHPRLLGREGAAALRPKLMLLRGWRLPPPLCPLVLARCPALLEESDSQLQEIADIFVGYGATWEQLHAVVLGYPTALRLQPELVRLPLKLLADFDIGMDKVAQYPRLFIHDPVQYLGPRLAFLKVYSPEKLRFKLVTLLSRGDEEFAERIADRLPEEYAVFKDAWVRQFEEQVDSLPLRPGMRPYALSRALWCRETTEDLWL